MSVCLPAYRSISWFNRERQTLVRYNSTLDVRKKKSQLGSRRSPDEDENEDYLKEIRGPSSRDNGWKVGYYYVGIIFPMLLV